MSENIRKIKDPELQNIKMTIRNYVGDFVLTRLISSKANQIKDEAMTKCHAIIDGGHSTEDTINKAGLIMLTSAFKIKGLEELVDEIKFFAKKDTGQTEPADNPHEAI